MNNPNSQNAKLGWPSIEEAERDLDFGQLYRRATRIINTLLEAQRPDGPDRSFPTVRVEGEDHKSTKLAYLAIGSGEGSSDFRFCLTPADVRQAYIDMTCGDYEAHKDEVDSFVAEFSDEEKWTGNMLDIELYCARFEVMRFPAAALFATDRSEGEKHG